MAQQSLHRNVSHACKFVRCHKPCHRKTTTEQYPHSHQKRPRRIFASVGSMAFLCSWPARAYAIISFSTSTHRLTPLLNRACVDLTSAREHSDSDSDIQAISSDPKYSQV